MNEIIRENPKDEKNNTPVNIHKMLEAFVDIVKDPPMDTPTVRSLFLDLVYGGFFGSGLKFSFLVNPPSKNTDLNTIICIRDPQSDHQYLSLDIKNLNIEQLSLDEVKKRRNNGTWLLEHPYHPIPGL